MARKVHVRQEILSSNPGQPFLTKIQPKRALGTCFFLPGTDDHGQRSRFRGTGSKTGTLAPLQPVPIASFLVVAPQVPELALLCQPGP